MQGWNFNVSGYGISINEKQAVQKAYGEAWERLWMLLLAANPGSFPQVRSSNGFAAGNQNQSALISSKNELIERAVLLAAWSKKYGWKRSTQIKPKQLLTFFALRLKGWKLNLFDISSSIGTVKACLAIHPEFGTVFDTCFSDNSLQSENKVILSVVKNTFFAKKVDSFNLPEVGSPEDHSKFYSDPKNSTAFNFLLDKGSSTQKIELCNIQDIESRLVVSAGVFPAVALSSNNSWPELTWGAQSICGINPWPHPLA
jgi:hypothetical protein